MAENSHAKPESHIPDVGHEDPHHHHEGPVVHTEVVPEKSPEDSSLNLVAFVALLCLMISIFTWSTKMEEPPPPSEHKTAPHPVKTLPTAPSFETPAPQPNGEDYHKFSGESTQPAQPGALVPAGQPGTTPSSISPL